MGETGYIRMRQEEPNRFRIKNQSYRSREESNIRRATYPGAKQVGQTIEVREKSIMPCFSSSSDL